MIKLNKVTPLHISHPICIVDDDGVVYKFTSREHADTIIERFKINVVSVSDTKPSKTVNKQQEINKYNRKPRSRKIKV